MQGTIRRIKADKGYGFIQPDGGPGRRDSHFFHASELQGLPFDERLIDADKLRDYYDGEAKERQKKHNGTAPGKKSLVENLPQVKSRDLAGTAVGVSGKLPIASRPRIEQTVGTSQSLRTL